MITLSTIAFLMISIVAMVNLVFIDWRVNAGALAILYLASFLLITTAWPISLAITKLITGWMATATISLTLMRQGIPPPKTETGTSLIFKALSGLLVIMVVFILSPVLQQHVFPHVNLLLIQSGLLLMSMSLLQLGIKHDPYLIIVSLLSFLAGFEIIHSALEVSLLLLILFVFINLGIALVGVYFIVKTGEHNETLDGEENK